MIRFCTAWSASITPPAPATDDFALTGTQNIYAIGDGGGFTRSLSHAAAHGLYIADKIIAGT